MQNELDLFAGVGNTEMDSVQEIVQPDDTKVGDQSSKSTKTNDDVLNWWEITWKGYDGIIHTIECEIYQEWPPSVIGVHPWGNRSDHKGIPMCQIISKKKITKPDPKELLQRKEKWIRHE